MPRPSYSFTEFVDIVLVRLYEAEQSGKNGLIDLDEIVGDIQGSVPPLWRNDAAKVLQMRGLANCVFTFGGTSLAISGEGRLYVESRKGETGKVRDNPAQYFITINSQNSNVNLNSQTGDISQSAVRVTRNPVHDLLDQMKTEIDNDKELSSEKKTEYGWAVEMLKLQVKKSEPDRQLISVLLDSLNKVTSIASHVATLYRFFTAAA